MLNLLKKLPKKILLTTLLIVLFGFSFLNPPTTFSSAPECKQIETDSPSVGFGSEAECIDWIMKNSLCTSFGEITCAYGFEMLCQGSKWVTTGELCEDPACTTNGLCEEGVCGDGRCDEDNNEDHQTCPQDCGNSGGYCGDGICNNGETSATCREDCPVGPGPTSTPTSNPTPTPTSTPTPDPTYACNSTCDTNEQCQTADANYICSTENNNKCRLATNPNDENCEEAITYECNSSCEIDEQCESANADYVCSTDYGDTCRLSSNEASETCQPQEKTYACNSTCDTDEQCQTANADYICSTNNGNTCRLATNEDAENCQDDNYEMPEFNCNDICTTNAQCQSTNTNYVCYEGACRLQTNPNSEECITNTNQSTAASNTTTYTQPVLPGELPESGSEDIFNWIKTGLGILGAGIAALLLL